MTPHEEFLTTKQVAQRWPFLTEGTLRYWRNANEGPKSFRAGRRVVYRRSEVERWLSEQELATTRGGAA
ncbi:helix-turn-helix domain-containing protein [Williamsia sp. 1135]|uniref:helix-turn-helix transcriptional regulator n=1 Tax=Williamsia sp. 1135 TaxID=1889262 RepID=UPI000A116A4A|nr:helix-turn-helix domain-containing protein [Williamsia sp. 1135]ORM37950.1 hypothetical protein BFL43_02125 [Williamsia sp. 1135]